MEFLIADFENILLHDSFKHADLGHEVILRKL